MLYINMVTPKPTAGVSSTQRIECPSSLDYYSRRNYYGYRTLRETSHLGVSGSFLETSCLLTPGKWVEARRKPTCRSQRGLLTRLWAPVPRPWVGV